MRSQGCTIQQALTPDAAAVVKQAVALAKRRGHAQVTPLHVAHTMLSVSSGLLRAACLQSHSHPLQCRALELCFNVALNRLPTSTSGPMLGPHSTHHYPTIANALVAAFKRAQAHQRRGSIENQQQPLLAVKIELEQLIISILDDPSVSRVMREAGFSSTLVKGKVEQAVSTELGSQNEAPNSNNDTDNNNNNTRPKNSSINDNCSNLLSLGQTGLKVVKPRLSDQVVRNEDVLSVIESLATRRKRNSVVVGECIATLEELAKEVMDRVEKGDVPEALKEVKFFQLSFSSFGHLSRDEVELRVGELKCLVKSCCMENNKGIMLYLDDLKWANEFRASSNILVDQHQPRRNYYCPIEHMIMEIGKLVLGYADCGKLWLLGIATFQTYMRCRSGQPSLETLWCLHAITIPAGSLGLSLIPDSNLQSPFPSKKSDISGNSWLMLEGGVDSCRQRSMADREPARSHKTSASTGESGNSALPSWLQQYKDANTKRASNLNYDQDTVPVKDLCKRWSSICTSTTHISQAPSSSSSFERTLSFSSISPSSSTSNFSYDPQYQKLRPKNQSLEPKNVWVIEPPHKTQEATFVMSRKEHISDHSQRRRATSFISSNPSSTPTSTSSSEIMEPMELQCTLPRFKEYNADNLKTLCHALEQKVPRQKDIVYDLASTVLHCRSGTARRKVNHENVDNNEQPETKEETWLFFQGVDSGAKESIARELAKLIFGSPDNFVSISLSSFSSIRADSSEESRNKRLRDEHSCNYIERLAEAVWRDPHRVFFVEDIDQVDYSSQMGIKKAIERGRIPHYASGEEVSFSDAVVILSCESFRSRSRACSPSVKLKGDFLSQENDQKMINKGNGLSLEETTSPSISLDLNISINDDDDNENNVIESQCTDEIGLLTSVDRCIVFKNQNQSCDDHHIHQS